MNSGFPDLTTVAYLLLLIIGAGLATAAVLFLYVILRIRRINLPEGANFVTALRATPFSVVLLLDLLDWGLDIFSAPITWFLLGHLGLAPLRGVAVVKDLIPFDNFIPVMTGSWLVARVLDLGQPLPAYTSPRVLSVPNLLEERNRQDKR